MTKQEFLAALEQRLQAVPEDERKRTAAYYDESIDDRMEDGMTEEEAVDSLESIDTIVQRIMKDTPLKTIVKNKVEHKKKLETWQVLLIIFTCPFWFPVGMGGISVAFGLCMAVFGIGLGLFATVIGLCGGGVAAVVGGIYFFISRGAAYGLMTMGLGFCCIGAGIFILLGSIAMVKGVVFLIKKFIQWLKACLSR